MSMDVKKTVREIKVKSIKNTAQNIYDLFCSAQDTRHHRAEEIIEMTGLVNDMHPAVADFKLTPVTDELSDEGIEDLHYLLVDLKDEICMKKIGKLAMYASPDAYMELSA